VGEAARAEIAKSKTRKAAKLSGTRGYETVVRPLRLVNDLRLDRDANAEPTADRENQPPNARMG
jgi:hypothetical protein